MSIIVCIKNNCKIVLLDIFFVILRKNQISDFVNLIVDIGNTIAKLAIFEDDKLLDVVCTSNDTLSGLSEFVRKYGVKKGIVSTVIDISDVAKEKLSSACVDFLMMDYGIKLPIMNLYKTPETLGSDRIAAVVGANMICPNRNVLVIDAGTCITYDFIDSENRYHGGNISPGIKMRFRALNEFTSRLPHVDAKKDIPDLGYDTETAVMSGVVNGVTHEIEGFINMMEGKYPGLFVFLTGGDAFSFDINLKNRIFADKFLVLRGLNRLLEYNEFV